jgi:glucose/arabinose dehydrogenase
MTKPLSLVLCATLALACSKGDQQQQQAAASAPPEGQCPAGNGGITLPAGFCATVFADSVGHVRDIVVAPNGDVFVNTWSGEYFLTAPPPGGFLIGMRDSKHTGKADSIVRFGPSPATKGTGGTGIALYKGYLYAEAGPQIVRYKLPEGQLQPSDTTPEVIVTGMPIDGDHPMHPFVIDSSGALYTDVGSASNSCQLKNRTLNSPGHNPCTELQRRAGVWKFDANKTNQTFSPSARYVTGLRNGVGIALSPDGSVWSTQHGRDQLGENFPELYTLVQSADLPAEELMHLMANADFGWPECYYDQNQKKLVLAPEYGGDGGKKIGVCANKVAPNVAFPGHWAPDGLAFYAAAMFPAHYQGGAFIAFHGSWDRFSGPQEGYDVVFQPFSGGSPSGPYETFADGFAGAIVQPDKAAHRPTGLAVAPDGALFITDDKGGTIWRVTH